MRKTVREQAILSVISETFCLLWRHRRLLYQTTVQDWRCRYAGSNSGNAWIGLYPFIFLSLHSVVCVAVLRARFGRYDAVDYIALMSCGLAPFPRAAEGFSRATAVEPEIPMAGSFLGAGEASLDLKCLEQATLQVQESGKYPVAFRRAPRAGRRQGLMTYQLSHTHGSAAGPTAEGSSRLRPHQPQQQGTTGQWRSSNPWVWHGSRWPYFTIVTIGATRSDWVARIQSTNRSFSIRRPGLYTGHRPNKQ